MSDLKETVRENLVKFRKKNKLTQIELAEKIGYSDKAVSRWETGEVTPDVETLGRIAQIYGVSPSALLEIQGDDIPSRVSKQKNKVRRAVIMLLSVALVWYTAVFISSVLSQNQMPRPWMTYIWAIPLSLLTVSLFSAKWGFRLINVIWLSLFAWTLILAIYLQLIQYNLFLLFPAGAPVQAVIILSYFIKSDKG